MQPGKKPPLTRGRDRHRIAVLVVPDTVALEVAIAQQVFGPRMYGFARITGDDTSPYEVILCGEEEHYVLPSGADLGRLAPLDVLREADTVIVTGLENPFAQRSDELLQALRDAQAAGARMVSFCGGAFVLGQAGILDRKRVTTHWVLASEFREQFPLATLQEEQLFIEDGNVLTSGGIFSATDLSLHMLAVDLGYAYSNDFSRLLVSAPVRPGGQAQFIKDSIRIDREPPLGSLTEWIREHLDEPLTMAGLAEHEHMSERNLARKFNQAVGMSPYDWITRERVNQAKILVETTDLPIGQIAAMVGLGSAESLRRNFSRLVGTSATSYRRAFKAEPALELA
ncbi:GlxA family transcriptional regulator [Gryllotalpicola reticulitermitis]|uniref:GlxA family transcriptional regulator n=1 Tax=Gryllotalpicola reticulitermitis TaxID=1184153 RepID=A0ABV8Q4V1_9MICO